MGRARRLRGVGRPRARRALAAGMPRGSPLVLLAAPACRALRRALAPRPPARWFPAYYDVDDRACRAAAGRRAGAPLRATTAGLDALPAAGRFSTPVRTGKTPMVFGAAGGFGPGRFVRRPRRRDILLGFLPPRAICRYPFARPFCPSPRVRIAIACTFEPFPRPAPVWVVVSHLLPSCWTSTRSVAACATPSTPRTYAQHTDGRAMPLVRRFERSAARLPLSFSRPSCRTPVCWMVAARGSAAAPACRLVLPFCCCLPVYHSTFAFLQVYCRSSTANRLFGSADANSLFPGMLWSSFVLRTQVFSRWRFGFCPRLPSSGSWTAAKISGRARLNVPFV